MNAKTRFCKALRIKPLPPPSDSRPELVSYYKPAAYQVLPRKLRASVGGIFCALLLGLMLGFSACSKDAKVAEPVVAEPGRSIDGPTLNGGGTAPNQGLTFTVDSAWNGDTIIHFNP